MSTMGRYRFLLRPGFLAFASIVSALVPGDLHHRDPLISALYHTEPFVQQEAKVPNTLQDARSKLEAMLQSDPAKSETHRALAEVHLKMLDFAAAETQMKLYAEKSKDYAALETYYHDRLEFQQELQAMQQHAAILPAGEEDVENGAGRYAQYKKIIDQIQRYNLPVDLKSVYLAAIDAYPHSQRVYVDYIAYLKDNDKELAHGALETFRQKFPSETKTYLLTKASLLAEKEGAELLNKSFDPLWSPDLYRAFDAHLVAANGKTEYLNKLKARLEKDPLDADAATRLFHAYHLAGNLMEAQNTLNDFRLLKEQKVREKKSSWAAKELHFMAVLNRAILNYNEAARYYYSLYSLLNYKKDAELQADAALHGLFDVLLAAEERPVQISSGNLDYYKDIAAMDQSPGILNGILSLILNGTDPQGEFRYQEDKAHGYFNRAEAMRLVRFTQRNYPDSKFLPAMYRDSLRVYQKYGMDRLLVESGETFFRTFPKSPELLEVGIAVTDAYARLREYEKEWNIYRFLLPIASERMKGRSLIPSQKQISGDEENFDRQPSQQQGKDYEYLLNRYIASLTAQNKHLDVVRLYQQEIGQHPAEEALYERFAAYLIQNRLFEEEKKLYEQAIARFQGKGWYEKLARWYLRFDRNREYEKLSQEMMDIFRGTEIETYLQQTAGSSQQLYFALNLHAHEKFPLNGNFVQNLLAYYDSEKQPEKWEALAAEYYYLDESIRENYLRRISWQKKLPESVQTSNSIYTRFAGDVAAWKSHFEEAATHYDQLAKLYPSDPELNIRLADLKRSLGAQDAANYVAAANIRERLARMTPSNSALWTSAGETMADIEQYDESKRFWNQILKIDPYQPDRYLEVATIYWDYYLFDDALSTIAKIRELKKDASLFAYETGAIYESKRDYPNAIVEYSKSLTDGSEMAWHRLGELYKRKKYTASIQKQIDDLLQKDPQNEKLWIGLLRFYAEQNEMDLARSIHDRAVRTLQKEPFAKVAVTLKQRARDLGWNEHYERVLERQIADSVSDVERWTRMLELARFHEANKQSQQAENIYERLYREQPKSAGIIQETVAFYWRTGQHGEAFAIYKEALAASNTNWRKTYLSHLADKYREQKDFKSALVYARDLLSTETLNIQHFQLVAELLAEQKDYAALSAFYKEGLKTVQESELTAEEKRTRIAGLRKGIIRANVILKDHTAALDQYIEIINRDAESEEGLREAADFASRYALTERLFDYYTKTAAASPKDHRWPMVLGRLRLYTGDYRAAIEQFQTAIAIRPERTEFYQQVAESYQRLGEYETAIQAYESAYEISFKNKRWLEPIAELHARLGLQEKAFETYAQTLTPLSPMEHDFALAQKAVAWGWFDRGSVYGKTALNLYYKDMTVPFPVEGIRAYLEALIRSGKRQQSFAVLRQLSNKISDGLSRAKFDAEELRSAQYMVNDIYANRYAELLRRYCLDEDWQKIEDSIFQEITQRGGYQKMQEPIAQQYLPMVRSANMAPAEERLLLQLAAHHKARSGNHQSPDWAKYMQHRSDLLSFYDRRQAHEKAARWLQNEFNTLPDPFEQFGVLIQIANYYRLAGLHQQELAALREYYHYGATYDLQPAAVHRYLDLLYKSNARAELKQAAAKANLISANYFFEKKDRDLSIAAIRSLYTRYKKDPSWQSIQLAMVGWQRREADELYDKSFRTALDLRTIGELISAPPDLRETLEGDAWFYYAKLHGEYLYTTGRKDQAAYHLPGDLEGLSTAAARQDQLGSFYVREAEPQKALHHFELALQLDGDNVDYFDRRARALVQSGRKQEAIEAWKALLAKEQHRDSVWVWQKVLQASIDFNFLADIQPQVQAFLNRRIQQTGFGTNSGLLTLYFNSLNEQQKVEHARMWIRTAPSPLEFGSGLLTSAGVATGSVQLELAVYSAVHDYLQSRALTAAGQEQRVVRNDLWQWNQAYVKALLQQRSYARAEEVLRTVQERFEDAEEPETEFNIALLHAEALIAAGRNNDAWQALQTFVDPESPEEESYREERYRKAIESMKGNEIELRLKEELYTWLLSTGRTEDAIYAGLAEVKLQKSELQEAMKLLHKMMFLNGENLEGIAAAAELLEKQEQWAEAIRLRNDLAQRAPRDASNRTRLAQGLMKTGQQADAAKLASRIVTDPSASGSDRADAAVIYANTASTLMGPAELAAIQKNIRAGQLSNAGGPYSHHLRDSLLKQTTQPPVNILRAELFLFPEEDTLKVRLFGALVREKKCLQAMNLLDPQGERSEDYVTRAAYERREEYDYVQDFNYPVERLKLTEQETARIALQMAECAMQLDDLAGEMFFRNMARAHAADAQQQKALAERIRQLEKQLSEQQQLETHAYRIALNAGRNP